jgi:hypothetical protein
MRIVAVSVALTLLFSIAAIAQTSGTSEARRSIEPLPRDLEIDLARSALPPHLREGATVYVLNPAKGFEVARKGTNGFHAFVARTGDDAMRGSWPLTRYRDDILYPISFDEAGAKANMRVFFDIAALQARGTPPAELKRTIQEQYHTGHYKAPERAGVSYMMSPVLRTYVDPDHGEQVATTNNPHVMYFAPNVSDEAVGGAKLAPEELSYFLEHGRWRNAPAPFVILHGPHGYMIQHLGVEEAARITKEYGAMLARLCQIKKVWCLP